MLSEHRSLPPKRKVGRETRNKVHTSYSESQKTKKTARKQQRKNFKEQIKVVEAKKKTKRFYEVLPNSQNKHLGNTLFIKFYQHFN